MGGSEHRLTLREGFVACCCPTAIAAERTIRMHFQLCITLVLDSAVLLGKLSLSLGVFLA
jgi:hypothetical protein